MTYRFNAIDASISVNDDTNKVRYHYTPLNADVSVLTLPDGNQFFIRRQ